MKTGAPPPTAAYERDGELTPPAITRTARAKSASECWFTLEEPPNGTFRRHNFAGGRGRTSFPAPLRGGYAGAGTETLTGRGGGRALPGMKGAFWHLDFPRPKWVDRLIAKMQEVVEGLDKSGIA